jgi:hypothetical protein
MSYSLTDLALQAKAKRIDVIERAHGEEWSKAKNLLDKAATKSGHDAASARGVVLRTEVNLTAAMSAAD